MSKLKGYEEQFRLAKKKRFGASSEQTHPNQLELPLYRTGRGVALAVIYDYQKRRGGEHPQIFLSGGNLTPQFRTTHSDVATSLRW
ncbi:MULTISPECIES: hypothetical protein [Paenibacillus]|uniref:IS66 family transposase n=1 Tax=Paenibacillus polymyxa TaxID=1406 RepID=UPI00273F8C7D|nr:MULTISPECIES: hypothetical protein [Paenibacillus]